MDDERAYRRGDRPDRELGWFDVDAVLIEEPLYQENRPYSDEDVLAEEERDVVDSGRVRANSMAHLFGELAITILGGTLGHGRDQRPDHLRVAAERCETQRGSDLADRKVREKNSRSRGAPESRHQRPRALLESRVLEEPDHGENEPDDRHVAARDERFSKCRNDGEGAESACNSGGETSDGNDEQRVYPKDEPDHDYYDADKREQLRHSAHRRGATGC